MDKETEALSSVTWRTQLVNKRIKFNPVCLSPSFPYYFFKPPWIWNIKYRHLGSLGFWLSGLYFAKTPLLNFTWESRHSELQKVHLPQPYWSLLIWKSLGTWLSQGEAWTCTSVLMKLDMWGEELSLLCFCISSSGPRLHTESQWRKSTFLQREEKEVSRIASTFPKVCGLDKFFILVIIWSVSAHFLCGCALAGWWLIFALTRLCFLVSTEI